jgi:hypothetical protein
MPEIPQLPLRGSAATKARDAFIRKFDPSLAKLIRQALGALRARFPTAVELVYDNYNALAIGLSPNERTSEVVVSLAAYARGVNLYFMYGAHLDDPHGLLEGSGNQGRFVRLTSVEQFSDERIAALLDAAEALGDTPMPTTGKGYTVIKSISAKQRPRRA